MQLWYKSYFLICMCMKHYLWSIILYWWRNMKSYHTNYHFNLTWVARTCLARMYWRVKIRLMIKPECFDVINRCRRRICHKFDVFLMVLVFLTHRDCEVCVIESCNSVCAWQAQQSEYKLNKMHVENVVK